MAIDQRDLQIQQLLEQNAELIRTLKEIRANGQAQIEKIDALDKKIDGVDKKIDAVKKDTGQLKVGMYVSGALVVTLGAGVGCLLFTQAGQTFLASTGINIVRLMGVGALTSARTGIGNFFSSWSPFRK